MSRPNIKHRLSAKERAANKAHLEAKIANMLENGVKPIVVSSGVSDLRDVPGYTKTKKRPSVAKKEEMNQQPITATNGHNKFPPEVVAAWRKRIEEGTSVGEIAQREGVLETVIAAYTTEVQANGRKRRITNDEIEQILTPEFMEQIGVWLNDRKSWDYIAKQSPIPITRDLLYCRYWEKVEQDKTDLRPFPELVDTKAFNEFSGEMKAGKLKPRKPKWHYSRENAQAAWEAWQTKPIEVVAEDFSTTVGTLKQWFKKAGLSQEETKPADPLAEVVAKLMEVEGNYELVFTPGQPASKRLKFSRDNARAAWEAYQTYPLAVVVERFGVSAKTLEEWFGKIVYKKDLQGLSQEVQRLEPETAVLPPMAAPKNDLAALLALLANPAVRVSGKVKVEFEIEF